jgi:hypothetical protein
MIKGNAVVLKFKPNFLKLLVLESLAEQLIHTLLVESLKKKQNIPNFYFFNGISIDF